MHRSPRLVQLDWYGLSRTTVCTVNTKYRAIHKRRLKKKERKREREDHAVLSAERDRARAHREDAEWSLLRRIQSPCEKRRDRQPDRLCMRHAGCISRKMRGIARRRRTELLVATGGRIELHLRTISSRFEGTWDLSLFFFLSFFLTLFFDTRRNRRLSAILLEISV